MQVRAARSEVQDTVDGDYGFPGLPVVDGEQLRRLPGRRHRVSGHQHENRTAADPQRIRRRPEYDTDAVRQRSDDARDDHRTERNGNNGKNCCE